LACPHNEKLYAKLLELKAHLSRIGDDHRAMNVKRISSALKKFPIPLISGRQAEILLQGVGPWFASKIDDLLGDIKLKRQRDNLDSDVAEQPSKVRKVDYVPGSASWLALVCSFYCPPSFSSEDFATTLAETVLKYFAVSVKGPLGPELEALVANGILIEDENYHFSLSSIGKTTASSLVGQCPPHLRVQRVSEDHVVMPEIKPDSWFDALKEEVEFPSVPLSSDERVKGFSITLVVDSVERLADDFESIKDRLAWRNINVTRNKLWIGDYHWLVTLQMLSGREVTYSSNVVVERKTADDLAASFVDGRYESQKCRLRETQALVIYLLEGTRPSASSKVSEDTVLNALMSTKFNFDFQVKICKDTEDTCNWLMRMTSQLLTRISGMTLGQVMALPTFEAFQNDSNPNKSLNVKDLFGKQIRALSKCGEQTTLAILQHYPTPQLLYRALIECQTTSKRGNVEDRLLKAVKLQNGSCVKSSVRQAIKSLFLELS
jgi:ERCC4-type nuclease